MPAQLRPDGLSLGRDLEQTREVLASWLAARVPEARFVELSELVVPGGSGSSSETLLFEASWQSAGHDEHRSLVARVKPTLLRHFYQDTFESEYRVLKLLGERTDVPVPTTYWFEKDASVLGAPFWIMEQVQGQVPSDNPPFNTAGFVYDATPAERRTLWLSALEALCELHTCDPGDLSFLAEPERGASGLEQSLSQWHDMYLWTMDGQADPIVDAAEEWLHRNLPRKPASSLSWGDARIGNMMFHNMRCAAILDWEMLSLGGPKLDLGYWLVMEDNWPGPRLEGFGDRDEVLSMWTDRTALDASDIRWYEAYAALRLTLALISHAKKVQHHREGPPGAPSAAGAVDYAALASPTRFVEALQRLCS